MRPVLPSLALLFFGAAFVACATTGGSPEAAADRILSALDEGRTSAADAHFAPLADDESARQKVYPVLFSSARQSYENAEFERSADVLGFMARHYPDARAVKEARVYALFLERSLQTSAPDPELVDELDEAVTELREAGSTAPPWLPMAEAQIAIDRGRPEEAPDLTGLAAALEGSPVLAAYVDDLQRALAEAR